MKLLKREWTGAPAWCDYLAQFLYWVALSRGPVARLKDRAIGAAQRLLDRYCRCERCLQRRYDAIRTTVDKAYDKEFKNVE